MQQLNTFCHVSYLNEFLKIFCEINTFTGNIIM